jgi:hypothetical protein
MANVDQTTRRISRDLLRRARHDASAVDSLGIYIRRRREKGVLRYSPGYNWIMSATRPKRTATPKVAPPPSKRPDLARGLPGTDRERAEERRRFAKEHRETLRRLGK